MSANTNTLGTQIFTGDQNENSHNSQVTTGSGNTGSAGGLGSSSYLIGSSTGVTITDTDFGAIQGALGIAQTALQTGQQGVAATLQGLGLLSGLTGQALLVNSEAIQEQKQPLGVTIAKGVGYVVAVLALGWVLVAVFGGLFKRKKD